MNILVTGSTSFIGSRLCERLVEKNKHAIYALSHSKTRTLRQLTGITPFTPLQGDIRDKTDVKTIFSNNEIDCVLHLASIVPHAGEKKDKQLYSDVNVTGTLNLLEGAASCNVKDFIFTSTMSVYSEPPDYLPVDELHPTQPSTDYGNSKLLAERNCQKFENKLNTTILRYAGVYGRGMDRRHVIPIFCKAAKTNTQITVHGDGRQTSDFVYIEDIIDGTIRAIEKRKPGIYNLGSGEETSVLDLAKKIIRITDSKSELHFSRHKPDRPFRFVLDVTKAKRKLGYSPKPLVEGLVDYLQNHMS